jgi:hypothetical protein
MVIGRALMVATVAVVLTTTGGHRAAVAHHDNWAAPLVGGLVGGYAVKSFMDYRKKEDEESRPAPPPAQAGPSAASIEDKLNVLDKLAAGGYITKEEYTARRQALLNEL